jgi:hypothetical protein
MMYVAMMKHCKVHPTSQDSRDKVNELIRQAFDELAVLHLQLRPFDCVYDEDLLNCKYEQRKLISDDIKVLKVKNSETERIHVFEELLENIDQDIEMLTVTRMVEYSKWKIQYMSVCKKIEVAKNKINKLVQLERNMNVV